MTEEIGAKLVVQNRLGFSRDMRASTDDVERLSREVGQAGRRAGLTARALGVMGTAGRGVGRSLGAAVGPSRSFALSLGVGAGGLAFAARRGWMELQELNKVEQQTAARMKSTGGIANVSARHIRNRSIALENLSSVDENLIGSGQNLLLTFRNVRNEVGRGNNIFDRATKSALNLSTAGFGSMDSASKMLGKSLNDPLYGMTALSRAGVTFSQEQKDTVKAMVEANNTLGAQKLILREVEGQVGSSAKKYGDSIEGMGNRVNDALGDLSRGLMTGLVPIVERYARPFTTWLGEVTDVVNRRGWRAAWREFAPPELRHNIDSIGGAIGGALVPAVAAFTIKIGLATVKLAPFLLMGSALADLLGVQVKKSDQLGASMSRKLGPGLGSSLEKMSALTREMNKWGPGSKAAAGLGILLGPSLLRGGAGMARRSFMRDAATTAGGAAAPGLLGRAGGYLRGNPRAAGSLAAILGLGALATGWKRVREEEEKAAMSAKEYIRIFGVAAAARSGRFGLLTHGGQVGTIRQGSTNPFAVRPGMRTELLGSLKQLNELHKDYIDTLTGSRKATNLVLQITRDATDMNKRQQDSIAALIGGYDTLGGKLSRNERQMVNNLLAVGDFRGALRLLRNELQENTRWLDNMTAAGRRAEEQTDWAWRTGRPQVPSGGGGGGGRRRGGGGDPTPPSGPRPERPMAPRQTTPVKVMLREREVGEVMIEHFGDIHARN